MGACVLRSLGDSKSPVWFLAIASVINIVLDLLTVCVLGMGVAGAAIATVVSQLGSGVLCVWYMRKHFAVLHMEKDDWRLRKAEVLRLLGMGVPVGLQFSITAIGSVMLQSAVNSLGAVCVSGVAVASKIYMLLCCPLDALGMAMATYTGQNYGAGKPDRILSGVKSATLIMVEYSVVIAAVMWALADKFALLFISPAETEIMKDTVLFLHINTSSFILLGSLSILRYTIQGAGYTRLSIFSGVSEMIARVLVSLYLVPALKFVGVCLGDPTAWFFANLFLIPAFVYVYHQLKGRMSINGVPANA